MDEVESLSSIISGKGESVTEAATPASPAAEPEKTETQEPETKAPSRDESGRFAKTEAKEEPKQETREQPKDDLDGRTVALRAERERRRQLEARLRELESKPPESKVSIFEDEEKGVSQRVQEQLRPLRETNFNMSMKLARLSYKDDFDKAEQAFSEAAENDPRLYDQLRSSADPGEFIYTIGVQLAELGPVGGNFAKYREKITGEFKGELSRRDEQIKALTAEIESLKKSQEALESIPRSLNKGTESAPRSKAEADPDDLQSLVRFKTG